MPSPVPARVDITHPAPAARQVRGAGRGRSGTRRPDIQGLRAVAVLMVVAYHAGLAIPGGFVGVDVFFVVSGFVITAMLQREWATTGTIRFVQFYVRRFKRLIPALALMAAFTLAVSASVLSPFGPQQNAATTALGAMFLSANFVIAATTGGYFDSPAATNPLLHTWSLSVEEQFYLAFPALLTLAWLIVRRMHVRTAPYALVGAVTVASFILAMAGSGGSGDLLGFYSSATRAWEFSVGALLALAVPRLAVQSRRRSLSVALVGCVLLAASLVLISEATPFPGTWTLLPVMGTALLLLAGTHNRNVISRLLGHAAMERIGDWSYSIYLWHWPFIVFAKILWPGTSWAPFAAALLSSVPALASFYWVEQPIRGIARLTPPRFALLVALTLTPPLALAGLVLFGGTSSRQSDSGAPGEVDAGPETSRQRLLYEAAAPFHVGNDTGCHNPQPISERSASDCTWNEFANGVPIYLVGDSNADHFSEAVIGAAEQLDRPVTIATIDTCPFFDVSLNRLSGPDPFFAPCQYFFRETLAWLTEQRAGLVIISNSDEVYLDEDVEVGLTPDAMSTDPVAKEQALVEGLTATVSSLQDAGHTVLLLKTVPHFVEPYSYEPDLCSVASIDSGTCGAWMPLEFTDDVQGAPRESIEAVADQTGASVLDTRDFFCSDEVCSTRTDDMVLYRDSFHISVPASQALAGEFERAISEAG